MGRTRGGGTRHPTAGAVALGRTVRRCPTRVLGLGGRISRFANVGATAAGLATRFAAARLSGNYDANTTAASLREALGGLKGPVMRMAQILSTVPGAIPEEYAAQMLDLYRKCLETVKK